jgi:hypothetical protein
MPAALRAWARVGVSRFWYYRLLAPVMLRVFCGYIGLLFTRLPG